MDYMSQPTPGERVDIVEKVPAVLAATRIVERLAADWPATTPPSVLVEELQLNRSTCYNILATLQRAGWVTNPGGRRGYSLGPRLLALTGVAPKAVAIVVQEEIDQLCRRLGFSVYAAEWQRQGDFVVVATAEPPTGFHVSVTVGARLEFSAPALLGAFAAWTPRERVAKLVEQNGLKGYTARSVTNLNQFFRDLDTVRELGYSRSLQQFNLSQSAVASPVLNEKGRPILAICVLGFASELDHDTIDEAGQAVRETANIVTQRIGGAITDLSSVLADR